ncbi:MAG: hypothetical protein P8J27_15095 [Mariniblastus sp.]|nr:hypothetical protein [Mariniblastus sp.]
MTNGNDVFDELKKERSGGMPWMVILNGDGNEIISSVGPKGNIGCPVEPFEIEHFIDMIRQSSEASQEQLVEISDAMTKYATSLKR